MGSGGATEDGMKAITKQNLVRARRLPVLTIWVLTIWLGLMAAWPSAEGAEPRRVVVFDFELIDTSLEGEVSGTRPDQERRLAMIGD